jgi:uncharacterized protein YdeI (YjbR/CyaY-like superfamily)
MSDSYPQLLITSRGEWREWLAEHGAGAPGVWVVTWKKPTGKPHVPYDDDIVDEAIAAGWVDSRPRSVDTERSALLVTPRKASSRWSAKNKQRVGRLTAAGLMRPAGLAAVEAAKAAGTWTGLDEVETLTEPDDLAAALDAVPEARGYWDAFPRSTRRAILEWISNAKTAGTRLARIERTVSDAAVNVRANQWRQPKSAGTQVSRHS